MIDGKISLNAISSAPQLAFREGLKKKSKNMMEFSIIGLTPPLPL